MLPRWSPKAARVIGMIFLLGLPAEGVTADVPYALRNPADVV
jgi:hypothetical protein